MFNSKPRGLQLWLIFVFVVATGFSNRIHAEQIRVAVAANFYRPMQALASDFTERSGHQVSLSAGSTGKLYAQIINGAPFDVFIAADQARPKALVDNGRAKAASQLTVAIGQLVLWSADPELIAGPQQLQPDSAISRLAIANPKSAPYGAAALTVMEHLGVKDYWSSRLVQGQNISHTYQYVSSGNATAGFVAASQVYHHGQLTSGSAWLVPESLHQPLKQDAVIINSAAQPQAAVELLNYFRSPAAKRIIESFGYQTQSH
ncbi:molybdate ABC transporter substrate-binding protein [Neiella sp. HB171785]|uniref:Molybdate ABC transporter substrate-binding protein n=1 Tax=Neiella litorisoli TaxID=2771431 RepID=A0A8J6QVC6_9GAMM|nr:molybdate ABC transporter substrate-binding protein [Neiella litorisoli]MBD1391207.1 molybdate ABC transporter substrate-binding protein [Neiella litorisoli]